MLHDTVQCSDSTSAPTVQVYRQGRVWGLVTLGQRMGGEHWSCCSYQVTAISSASTQQAQAASPHCHSDSWSCVDISYLIISQYLAFRQQTTQPFAQSEASLLSRVIRGHGTECRSLAVQKPQLDIYNGSSMAGEFWIQLFGSCVQEQEPPPRYSHSDNTAQILRKSNSPEHKTFKRKASERMLMMLEVDIY